MQAQDSFLLVNVLEGLDACGYLDIDMAVVALGEVGIVGRHPTIWIVKRGVLLELQNCLPSCSVSMIQRYITPAPVCGVPPCVHKCFLQRRKGVPLITATGKLWIVPAGQVLVLLLITWPMDVHRLHYVIQLLIPDIHSRVNGPSGVCPRRPDSDGRKLTLNDPVHYGCRAWLLILEDDEHMCMRKARLLQK